MLQRVEQFMDARPFLQQVLPCCPVVILTLVVPYIAILQRRLANHHVFYICHNRNCLIFLLQNYNKNDKCTLSDKR